MKVAIIDYGVGNLGSLRRALEPLCDVFVTEEKEKILEADAIVLPGVGAFAAGMEGLRVRDLVDTLQDAAKRSVPMLGICLGAQLFLDRGFEFGTHEGLGIVPGEVKHFPKLPQESAVPAIGWQEVSPTRDPAAQRLFAGIDRPCMYFVHSYVLVPAREEYILARTMYGGYGYCAVMGKSTIIGTQFHPEKSGEAGQQFLKNFIASI